MQILRIESYEPTWFERVFLNWKPYTVITKNPKRHPRRYKNMFIVTLASFEDEECYLLTHGGNMNKLCITRNTLHATVYPTEERAKMNSKLVTGLQPDIVSVKTLDPDFHVEAVVEDGAIAYKVCEGPGKAPTNEKPEEEIEELPGFKKFKEKEDDESVTII